MPVVIIKDDAPTPTSLTCPNGHQQIIVNEEEMREETRCNICGTLFSTLDTATEDR